MIASTVAMTLVGMVLIRSRRTRRSIFRIIGEALANALLRFSCAVVAVTNVIEEAVGKLPGEYSRISTMQGL